MASGTLGAAALRNRLAALREVVALSRSRVDGRTLAEAEKVLDQAAARDRYSHGHTVVALAGSTGSGKSTLFNALVGAPLAAAGTQRPTTCAPLACSWSEDAEGLLDRLGVLVADRHRPARPYDPAFAGLVLIDLPDHDSVSVGHRARVERLLGLVDVIVWVVDPEKYADAVLHERYLRPLAGYAEVMVVALNQVDRLPGNAAGQVVDDLRRLLDEDGVALGEHGEPGATVLALSALTGEGVGELRETLGRFAVDCAAAERRLTADVDGATLRLRPAYLAEHHTGLSERACEEFEDGLADAAGVVALGQAAERAWLRAAAQACGTPWARLAERRASGPRQRPAPMEPAAARSSDTRDTRDARDTRDTRDTASANIRSSAGSNTRTNASVAAESAGAAGAVAAMAAPGLAGSARFIGSVDATFTPDPTFATDPTFAAGAPSAPDADRWPAGRGEAWERRARSEAAGAGKWVGARSLPSPTAEGDGPPTAEGGGPEFRAAPSELAATQRGPATDAAPSGSGSPAAGREAFPAAVPRGRLTAPAPGAPLPAEPATPVPAQHAAPAPGEPAVPVRAERVAAPSVARPAVEHAVRAMADDAAAGLPRPWARAVREVAQSAATGLAEALDEVVEEVADRAVNAPGRGGSPLRRPRWWAVAELAQKACLAAQLGGLCWLVVAIAGLVGGAWWVPTALLVAGWVTGPALAHLCTWAARGPARQHGEEAERQLRERVAECGRERVLEAVLAELARYRQVRERYVVAAGGV
ncbi:GTPase [Streptomyces buecherae]|uniref:GTPase n=1 Tax=Streptomyces buecherae TaxID=2763006 RepID=UPI0039F6EEC4